MSNQTQFEQNFLHDFSYFIHANHQPEKIFCQFISNHLELENGVKMTPKHCSFLSTLFFTCFCTLAERLQQWLIINTVQHHMMNGSIHSKTKVVRGSVEKIEKCLLSKYMITFNTKV